ncbi:MAG: hypothetical protein ACKOI2_06815 [Actinomycetota bacterium]
MIRMTVRRTHRSHALFRQLFRGAGIIALSLVSISLPSFTLMTDGVRASTSDGFVTTVDDTSNSDAPDSTANDFLDLERSLTECISSNPPPGCGRAPTSPGDRGGWQQLVLFGVMMSGISVIFWRVARAVRRREAAVQPE